MTKDQLTADKAQLEARVKQLEEQLKNEGGQYEKKDIDVRTSLSIALGAGTYTERYSDSKQIVYSWFAIFREIGKLLERKKQADVEDEVKYAHERLDRIDRRIEEITNPQPCDNPSPFRSR